MKIWILLAVLVGGGYVYYQWRALKKTTMQITAVCMKKYGYRDNKSAQEYMKKHNLTQQQFDELLSKCLENEFKKKSDQLPFDVE